MAARAAELMALLPEALSERDRDEPVALGSASRSRSSTFDLAEEEAEAEAVAEAAPRPFPLPDTLGAVTPAALSRRALRRSWRTLSITARASRWSSPQCSRYSS